MMMHFMPKGRKSKLVILIVLDILVVQFSSFLALTVRFDFNPARIPEGYAQAVLQYSWILTLCTILIFFFFHMYSTMWSVAGITEVLTIFSACLLSALVQISGMTLLELSVPRSYYWLWFFSLFICETGIRLSYRIGKAVFSRAQSRAGDRILLVGAGKAGAAIVNEMATSRRTQERIVCVVDDDPNKIGKYLRGILVEGNCSRIPELADKHRADAIYVAMPSATAAQRKEILEICKETGRRLKTLPGMYQLLNGEVSIAKLRDVQIEDLLGREPIRVNMDEIMEYVSGQVILVTGGGGSIGSELCRQIAKHQPRQLIIFDIYENNAYELQQELKRDYPGMDLVVLIGSVRNTHRIESVFEKYRPDIVYHAAAHKHVPLMEDSPDEAIKNNVFGTYKTAVAADKYGARRFVLISTDKAVNPTNIMGASKRMCEMVIQMMNGHSRTDFVAVRFGNVLGSSGSVIPLFKKQIAAGGPVTVTHPDIIRYFMTIQEAVSLVLQAGAYAKGGEIFVLDMGEPVKILDMARNLIRLSGYVPDVDIPIVFTGLRPGEKLYEELLMREEGLQDTPNKLIHIGRPIEFDEEEFCRQLVHLYQAASRDSETIRQQVKKIVPTYHDEGEEPGKTETDGTAPSSAQKGESRDEGTIFTAGYYGRGDRSRGASPSVRLDHHRPQDQGV